MALQCRTCATVVFDTNTRNLFSEDNAKLLLNIELVCGTKLANDPKLPGSVCPGCIIDVSQAVAFRERCLQTQKELLSPEEISGFLGESLRIEEKQAPPEYGFDIADEDFLEPHCMDELETGSNPVEDPLTSSPKKQPENVLPVLAKRPRGRPRKFPPKPKPSGLETKRKRKPRSAEKLSKEQRAERNIEYQRCERVCEICGRKFRFKNNFKMHMLAHSGVKQFPCLECDKSFYTDHLREVHHQAKHLGMKPYPCRYCDKTFAGCSHRSKHERIHRNSRPHKCRECDKCFISSDKLKRHNLIHSGIRDFSCSLCNQSFQRNTHLKQHLRSKIHISREEKLKRSLKGTSN